MANKKTKALSAKEYKLIIETMKSGFITKDEKTVRLNNKISTVLVIQANLGLRISDVLSLRLKYIVKDRERYRLDIIEQKTEKK